MRYMRYVTLHMIFCNIAIVLYDAVRYISAYKDLKDLKGSNPLRLGTANVNDK